MNQPKVKHSEDQFTDGRLDKYEGKLPTELLHAYFKTDYLVHDKGAEFILKIGQRSDQLNQLYEQTNKKSAAYITAYNPNSTLAFDEENIAAHAALLESLKKAGYDYYLGVGQDPEQEWPGEVSVLILGISRQEAEVLSQRLGQTAFLWADKNAVLSLVITKTGEMD